MNTVIDILPAWLDPHAVWISEWQAAAANQQSPRCFSLNETCWGHSQQDPFYSLQHVQLILSSCGVNMKSTACSKWRENGGLSSAYLTDQTRLWQPTSLPNKAHSLQPSALLSASTRVHHKVLRVSGQLRWAMLTPLTFWGTGCRKTDLKTPPQPQVHWFSKADRNRACGGKTPPPCPFRSDANSQCASNKPDRPDWWTAEQMFVLLEVFPSFYRGTLEVWQFPSDGDHPE